MPPKADKPSSRGDQFIAEVRVAMDAQGVSRAELATRLGCTTTYVGRLLKGGNNPTLETMEKLVDALHLDFTLVVQSRNPTEAVETAEVESDEAAEAEAGKGAAGRPNLISELEIRTLDDAHSILDTGGRELRGQVLELLQEAALRGRSTEKPGPKPGSGEDFRPHMLYMAMLLESGKTASKRKAAKWTQEWAEASGHAHASWETLRSRFRKVESFYRAQARRILAREQREAAARTPGDTRTEVPVARPARSASTTRGTGDFHMGTLAATHLSALDWVNKELARIGDQYRLAADKLAVLQSPGVLEAVGRLAEMQEIAGAMQLVRPDTTAVDAVNRHLDETITRWNTSSAAVAVSEATRQAREAAARLEPSILQAHEMAATRFWDDQMAAMSPDLTKRLRAENEELTERLKALTRNPLSDLL
jgi:transcriptional regulator with XRE-family HTH domain